jgi:hypothetical protein
MHGLGRFRITSVVLLLPILLLPLLTSPDVTLGRDGQDWKTVVKSFTDADRAAYNIVDHDHESVERHNLLLDCAGAFPLFISPLKAGSRKMFPG